MSNTIKPKRSYTSTNVPSGLAAGELAVNAADKKTWIGNSTGTGNVLIASLSLSDMTGTLAIANGGTNITSYTVGDLLYCSASNVLSKLAGNTTTGKQFLSQTGTGSASAAPSWSALPSYLPVYTRSGSTTNVSVANGSFTVTLRGGSTVNVTVS
jgi:hypothetical protein